MNSEDRKEKLVPTTARSIEDSNKDTVRLASGRVFTVQAVNPMLLYDLGVLSLPDSFIPEQFKDMSPEQAEKSMDDDTRILIMETAKMLIGHGVTSVKVLTDPSAAPDPEKNEISLYSLTVSEWMELAMHIDRVSDFRVVGGGDDSFRNAPESVGSGDEEQATPEHDADAAPSGEGVPVQTERPAQRPESVSD